MAQLNYYTYLSQVTLLIIIYLLYYCINKQIIIPRIVEKIKIKNYMFNLTTRSIDLENKSKITKKENTSYDLNKYYIKINK